MQMFIKITILVMMISTSVSHIAVAKERDSTLSLIYNQATSQSDMKRLNNEFGKEFSKVQTFDLRKDTNFYIYYYITDENYIQYETTKQDQEELLGRDTSSQASDGYVGSARYEADKRRNFIDQRFSSGARNVTAKVVEKPFKGTMILFNSYGTELFQIETSDYYKSESGALRGAIKRMRNTIRTEKEKMAIPQKSRCLFCDYNDLKDRQKEKATHLAFLAHEYMLNQLYGGIAEIELPKGLSPYANLYLSLEDLETLEHIIDTDALVFDNQSGTKRLPGHLINFLIKSEASDQLLNKVARAYQKNNFEELDINNHTPLWSAVAQQDTDLMQKLLDLGANANHITQVNESILSPLILSAQLGNIETSKLLLNNGAKKELTTPTGQSAWSMAMWLGKYDHADILWPDAFIDPNSDEAKNFLTQASYFGEREKVNIFIKNGAPLTARGLTGDNIIMSAIKGIKTFSVENNDTDSFATKHKANQGLFWQIIDDVKNQGFSDPIISSVDRLKQTLLFHAYPESNNAVTDQHVNLITRLIKEGIDPEIININGQTAEQKYFETRLKYFDELYKNQLAQINQERRNTAELAQIQQDAAMDLALNEISDKKKSRSISRARTKARRIDAINRRDDVSAQMMGTPLDTSNFAKDTSDVDYQVNYDQIENSITEQIRSEYTNTLNTANEMAIQQKQVLELNILSLKTQETENSKKRQIIISNVAVNR